MFYLVAIECTYLSCIREADEKQYLDAGSIPIKRSALDGELEHVYIHSVAPFPTNDGRKNIVCLWSHNCNSPRIALVLGDDH